MQNIKKLLASISTIIMVYICYMVVLKGNKIEYPCKRGFDISNIKMLGFVLLCLIITIICFKVISFPMGTVSNLERKIICLSMLVGIVQIYISYNYYFLTGWDVDAVYQTALEMVNNTWGISKTTSEYSRYFSIYPNNIELLGIFVVCLKVNQYLGVLDTSNGIMMFVIINSSIMVATEYCLFSVLKSIWNEKWAMLGWMIFIAYIGLSPWVTIPYSDSVGLIFPILELKLFLEIKKGKRKWLYSLLLGIITGVGYLLKPQTSIMFIAVLMWEFLKLLFEKQKIDFNKKLFIGMVVLCAIGLKGTSYIPNIICNSLNITLDVNKKFGMTHFIMMGMNPDTEGVYSLNDCEYSASFQNEKERKKAEINTIKKRLNNYGIKGYTELLNKKLLTTYGDGTFAWGIEGGFWKEILPQKNNGVSEITRKIYYETGEHYNKFMIYMQFFWIMILFLQCFSCGRNNKDEIYIVYLSMIGLLSFELLFESRARYLYTFSPVFILLAVGGLRNIRTFAKSININCKRLSNIL